MEDSLPAWTRVLCGRHGGDAHRIFHARDDFRPAPVTNMYESVVYVGLGVTAIGLILELIYRKRFIAVAAAAVSTVALILADNCPSVLDRASNR